MIKVLRMCFGDNKTQDTSQRYVPCHATGWTGEIGKVRKQFKYSTSNEIKMKLATKVEWSTPARKWSDSAIEDTERYREVDTGKEKFREVLENNSGRPSSSISEHAATLQYSISNHYYNLVGDVVKIYAMIRNFEVVQRRNMKTQ